MMTLKNPKTAKFSQKERFLLTSDIVSDNICVSFNGDTYFLPYCFAVNVSQ
jgi:hypothetical protein